MTKLRFFSIAALLTFLIVALAPDPAQAGHWIWTETEIQADSWFTKGWRAWGWLLMALGLG